MAPKEAMWIISVRRFASGVGRILCLDATVGLGENDRQRHAPDLPAADQAVADRLLELRAENSCWNISLPAASYCTMRRRPLER